MHSHSEETGLDLIWGAEGVAPIIKRSVRQARHMLRAGLIPARRVGRTYCTTRTELAAVFLASDQPTNKAA